MKRILSALVLGAMVLGLMSVGFAVSAADEPGAPLATTDDTVLLNFFSNGYGENMGKYWSHADADATTLSTGETVIMVNYPENSGQKTYALKGSAYLDITDYLKNENAYLQVMVYNPNGVKMSVEFQSQSDGGAGNSRESLSNYTPVASENGWSLYEIPMTKYDVELDTDTSWVTVPFVSNNIECLSFHAHSNTVPEIIYIDDVRIIEKATGTVVAPADPTPADPAPADPTPTQPSSSANTFDLTAIALVATAASAAAFAVSKKRK